MLRNGRYYFVIKINGQTLKKSLKTDNYTYANILKYKILNIIAELNKKKVIEHNIGNDIVQQIGKMNLGINKGSSSLNIDFESEEERALIEEFYNTIVNKANRLKKSHNITITEKSKRDTQTLKKSCDHFLKDKKKRNRDNDKIMYKYTQAVEYLYIYFSEKRAIKDITSKEATDFRGFLLEVPSRWKQKADLKDKNLRLLIDKDSKLLEPYPKQSLKTIDEVMKKVKEMFEFFVDNSYIYKNPFSNLKSMTKKTYSDKREFTEAEARAILTYLRDNKHNQDYNFFQFLLMTGLRRGEAVNIQVKDIDLDSATINVQGTKTENAKRIMVIHKSLFAVIKEQLQDKSFNDFLFYNEKDFIELEEKSRENKVGILLNKHIKAVVGAVDKKFLDVHSLRKNFSQILYLSNQFNDIEMKTLIGHSTSKDTTDRHYLRGKRDFEKLKEKIDRVDFTPYLDIKKIEPNDEFLDYI